jgi:RNA polymerase sigma-70 factor (ECF subfamily)
VVRSREGDLTTLEKILAADATWSADGGGRANASPRPIEGREKVVRLLAGIGERWTTGLEFTPAEINGTSGLTAWAGDELVGVLSFEVRGGLIGEVRIVVNPEKLGFVRGQLAAG